MTDQPDKQPNSHPPVGSGMLGIPSIKDGSLSEGYLGTDTLSYGTADASALGGSIVPTPPNAETSFRRVTDIAATFLCWYRALQKSPLPKGLLASSMVQGIRDDPARSETIAASLFKDQVHRAGHQAIAETLDAYVAQLDDLNGGRLIGGLIKRVNALVNANVLRYSVLGGSSEASRRGGWIEEVKKLRDHMRHACGHIDFELDEGSSQRVRWIAGLRLGALVATKFAPVDESKLAEEIFPASAGHEFITIDDPEIVEGIVASVVYVSWLTYQAAKGGTP